MTTKEQQEIDILRAENARLRDVLKNLADSMDFNASRKGRHLLDDLKAARAALAAKGAK